MVKLQIDFNQSCTADVEMEGTQDAWTAIANISGHPSVKQMQISYRLCDFIKPIFLDKENIEFFSPLLDRLEEQSVTLLQKELPLGI